MSKLDLTKRHGYCRFLQSHHFAYVRLAAMLNSPVVEELAGLLATDLECLGCEAIDLSEPDTLKVSSNAPHMIGVSYVLGGSHFGKNVLRKRWSKSDDAAVKDSGRFLQSDGNRKLWLNFQSLVSGRDFPMAERQTIETAAEATFQLFATGLKFSEVHRVKAVA
jgi:heme oxygenase